VIGGRAAGLSAGFGDLVTVDIGGTSCDVALVQSGEALIRGEGLLDGYIVRTPMVDVNAIGAGGGSIAWIDSGGGLRVGPQSAGAEPGPACYGRGGADAAITDASVVLGWLDPGYFAGGTLRLDPALAAAAIDAKVAQPLGMSRYAAALGMHRVLNAAMSEAIRLVSVGRGIDPRGLSLVPLGGGGGIHATALAAELGMPRVLVPRRPGVLSAAGLLAAPVEHEAASTFAHPLRGLNAEAITEALRPLDAACAALLRDEELDPTQAEIRHEADVCYIGQSHHLAVTLQRDDPNPIARLARDFEAVHARVHGHATGAPARIVNLRAIHRIATGEATSTDWAPEPRPAQKGLRRIVTAATPDGAEAPVWDRLAMPAGTRLAGPAVVEQPDTTILVEPGWHGRVLGDGTLLLERVG
jgi:N-methylhydantoinase A/oxoprolinase/acetone carboxylase beta subunit